VREEDLEEEVGMRNGVPILAVVGKGRAGKDTSAEWLRDNTVLRFDGGCSWHGREIVAEKLGISVEEAWQTRHDRRMEWYRILCEFRQNDPARLVKRCLVNNHVVCGVRDGVEMRAAIDEGLIDLVIWIERAVPDDPTLTFGPEVADVIIDNNGTLKGLYRRLFRLAKIINVMKPN
jgi:hypothetical protein